MRKEIISACEAFSSGDSQSSLPFVSRTVRWTIVGQKALVGVEALQKLCAAMTAKDRPAISITRKTIGDNRVVIEGREQGEKAASGSPAFQFCDVFHIEDTCITAITSYVICTQWTQETDAKQ